MSDHTQREAVASLLLEYVNKGDITKVESHLNQFKDDSQWRDIIRCEFPIHELITDTLQYDLSLPRLLSYDITTLSPFHYAALRGLSDILMSFLDHDVPVDVPLSSGTTALHLAAFGGKTDCVKMLLEIYKADLNKQDRYGWSALHYASTEGQYDVVKLLVVSGIDKTARDQDGTSAAYRAQINGYHDIVKLVATDNSDLLKIDQSSDQRDFDYLDDIYSQVGTKHATMPRNRKADSSSTSSKPVLRKAESMPPDLRDTKKTIVRRLIQNELKSLDQQDPYYLQPKDCLNSAALLPSEEEALALRSIGPNTLKGVLREEISKFTKQIFSQQSSVDENLVDYLPPDLGPAPKPPPSTASANNREYEDIYETVKIVPAEEETAEVDGQQVANDDDDDDDDEAAPPPPPLPPRVISSCQHDDDEASQKSVLQLSTQPDSAALRESLTRIAEVIGTDWKKLAYKLPLGKTPAKTQQQVDKIEKKHPGNVKEQASAALVEWRLNRGPAADVDSLIIALRECGLSNLIDEVDRASQEFTA